MILSAEALLKLQEIKSPLAGLAFTKTLLADGVPPGEVLQVVTLLYAKFSSTPLLIRERTAVFEQDLVKT